jgi:hypothetical protein
MTSRWILIPLLAQALWAQPRFDASIETLTVEGSPPVIYASHPLQYGTSSALFRSADDGASWMPVHLAPPGLPQPPVRSLLADPNDPAILFTATDLAHGSIWRSADGGANWTPSANGLPAADRDVRSLFLLRSNPSQMYARTTQSVYKSVDGMTW